MSINIKNPEVSRKAGELAALTGESITEAVGKAVEERLERLGREAQKDSLDQRIADIQKEFREQAPDWWFTWDYDSDLYDELGLPK